MLAVLLRYARLIPEGPRQPVGHVGPGPVGQEPRGARPDAHPPPETVGGAQRVPRRRQVRKMNKMFGHLLYLIALEV